jgi:uncharacterized membrane-anchored protein
MLTLLSFIHLFLFVPLLRLLLLKTLLLLLLKTLLLLRLLIKTLMFNTLSCSASVKDGAALYILYKFLVTTDTRQHQPSGVEVSLLLAARWLVFWLLCLVILAEHGASPLF